MLTLDARTQEPDASAGSGYRDLLVPTDLSDPSNAALEQAAVIARRFGGRLTLFHALEFPDHDEPHWAFGDRGAVWAHHDRSAREQLVDRARSLDVPYDLVVEHAGSPSFALLERISASAPDLIVMTTHGRGGFAHLLLGSVAERVVRKCTTPLLCLRGRGDLERALSGCTVVATDFSAEADAALQAAGLLADAFGGELVVVATPRHAREHPWQPYALAEQRMATLARHIPVRFLVDTAPQRAAVARVVAAERAGLVVTARGRAGVRASGAEAAAMVRNTPCSVLVV